MLPVVAITQWQEVTVDIAAGRAVLLQGHVSWNPRIPTPKVVVGLSLWVRVALYSGSK